MIDGIIKNELKIDLHIKTYKILPTKTNGGLIQIVGHSETLYNISQKRKMSILNYMNTILPQRLKIYRIFL